MDNEDERRKVDIYTYIYLICSGSNDADWKGKSQSKKSSKYESPPWHLNLIFHENAQSKRQNNRQKKKQMEPPTGYILVLLH